MLSSFVFFVTLFLDQANGHGRLTVPTTRLGNPARYENDPVIFSSKQFICRNDKNPNVTPPSWTAGDVIQITYDLSAPHVGDAAVYLSYDDEPFATRENMQFFKIANIPRARDRTGTPVSITLPSWLPDGNAILRWEWYALHVNPKIEMYAQCVDVIINNDSADALQVSEVPKYYVVDRSNYDPATLPKQNSGDIWDNVIDDYRNAFDTNNYPQFMTGPECALGYTDNNCAETAVGTTGWVDMGLGAPAPSPPAPSPPAPVPAPPAPVPSPATSAPTNSPTQSPVVTTPVVPAPATTTTTAAPPAPAPPAPVDGPSDPAPAPTPGGQCDGVTLWSGSTCGGGSNADLSECCPSGTACYAVNPWWSGCLPECQAGWLCAIDESDSLCPTRFSGSKCGGLGFEDNVGCCANGFNCYKFNDWWSGCFEGDCPAGYECD